MNISAINNQAFCGKLPRMPHKKHNTGSVKNWNDVIEANLRHDKEAEIRRVEARKLADARIEADAARAAAKAQINVNK